MMPILKYKGVTYTYVVIDREIHVSTLSSPLEGLVSRTDLSDEELRDFNVMFDEDDIPWDELFCE